LMPWHLAGIIVIMYVTTIMDIAGRMI
jgi:hypothetical protein